MADQASYNDKPITAPSEDRFRIDPFARTIAASIQNLAAPEGTVIALNGPWGSGKSSAVNLILHHLKDAIDKEYIAVINFACWWFRGEDALALAFFRELYAGLEPSLGERIRKVLPNLAAKLLRAGSMVGAGIDFAGGAGAGTVASGAMNWLSGLISGGGEPVEKLHAQLAAALKDQKRRFLIVIDDIDRLSPDEALLIFRLVKSVGRLPNVIYLLVFDRELAETIVRERYPSEGPHYLEKIIQASFDLPPATPEHLSRQLLDQIVSVCGMPPEKELTRFMNVYYDVVAPLVNTPRDLNRVMNGLSVTWAAIGGELDRADFIGLEALRLLQPDVYRRIRSNKKRLCGTGRTGRSESDRTALDRMLFGPGEVPELERWRRTLRRLFEPLESVWSNVMFGEDSSSRWARDRRACSEAYFDAYFRFTLGDEVLSLSEIEELVARANDRTFLTVALKDALGIVRSDGSTKAALLLDQLNLHADKVGDDRVGLLLDVLFELADTLDVESDRAKGFSFGNNSLRIHWLLRRLIEGRFDDGTRSRLLMNAYQRAPLGWSMDFAVSAYEEHHPKKGERVDPNEPKLLTESDADKARETALERMHVAAASGALMAHGRLAYLLYRWRDLSADGDAVKAWTAKQLERDENVVRFAQIFTSYSWSQSSGDVVARKIVRAGVSGLETIMDTAQFRARVEGLSASGTLDATSKEIVSVFLGAWQEYDKHPE